MCKIHKLKIGDTIGIFSSSFIGAEIGLDATNKKISIIDKWIE